MGPFCVPGSYAHALDGLYRVAREEGLRKLFSGATMASSRGMLVTVGQLSCYDQAKQLVLGTGYLSDGIFTHFIASFIAGGCATVLCQPLDVLKTRLMNSKGEYQVSGNLWGVPARLSGWRACALNLGLADSCSLSAPNCFPPSCLQTARGPLCFLKSVSLTH